MKDYEQIFDNAQSMHLQEFISYYKSKETHSTPVSINKEFIIGYHSDENVTEGLMEFKNETDADFLAEEWCKVTATSFEEACKKYDESFLKWKGEQSKLSPKKSSIDKEVLEITDEKLEDLAEGNAIMHLQEDEEETHSAARKTGFKDGYVLGYKEAVSIIGKGYNPAAMEERYKALDKVVGYLADLNGSNWIGGIDTGSIDMRQRAKNLQSVVYKTLQNSKL